MNKNLSIAAFFGMTAVILGAFAAHALQKTLTADALESIQTAVRYQMVHALLLLILNMYAGFKQKFKNNLTILMSLGILFFSGSIYAIYLAKIPAKAIWFITPTGGLLLVLGWLLLLFFFLKSKTTYH